MLIALVPNAGFSDDLASFHAVLAQGDCSAVSRFVAASPRKALLEGLQLETGACAPKDELKALARYREAAAAKDNDGRYSFFVLVGTRSTKGEKVPPDLWREAWSHLTAAAEANHPSACKALADAYQYGFEVKKDETRAERYRACAK